MSAPGYAPSSQSLVVHGPVTGLAISLSTMLYPVTGTVTDGLTHLPLPGVGIAENGAVLGVSDANGLYEFQLATESRLGKRLHFGSIESACATPIAVMGGPAERARLLPERVGVPVEAGGKKVVSHLRQKMIQWMDCW